MDFALGIGAILLGIATFLYSGQYNTDMYLYEMIGGGVFPRICAIIIALCGIEIIVEEALRRKKAKAEGAETQSRARGNETVVVKVVAAVCIYVLFMEKIGFCVSTALLGLIV